MKAILIILLLAAVVFIVEYNLLTSRKNRMEAAELELRKYMAEGSAEDIDNAKKYYNAVVKEYNNAVESFPTSIVAGMFSFPEMHTDGFDEEK